MNSYNPSSPYSGRMSKCRTKLFLGSNWLGQNRQLRAKCPVLRGNAPRSRAGSAGPLSTGPELWPALACWREITTLLPWAVCFRTGFHCHFCCDQCWQVLCFLDCYYCHCWCWTVHCHLLWLSWCVWGSTLLLLSLPWSLSEIPMQATAEQRCGSKNWSVIQIVELFRNVSFSWGQQKTWGGIGCWPLHRSSLSVPLWLGARCWPTGTISFYSYCDLILEALLLFLLPVTSVHPEKY